MSTADAPSFRDAVPRAAIFGCAGPALTADERAFFRDSGPLGFILFARNCESPDQVRELVGALTDCVGHDFVPVLIDQEGGRVARLGPPHWRQAPPMAAFGTLARRAPGDAINAARLNTALIALELFELGVNVDCAPVLDLPVPGAHDVIGDRALSSDPHVTGLIGRAICETFLAGGVIPVVKHIPGHGRARVDSHAELPVVAVPRTELAETDFRPFRILNDMPWAMTAHVVYSHIDAELPATLSAPVVETVIRDDIGFDGLLVTDDVSMKALAGEIGARAAAALAAGCDVVLHCNGEMAEMRAIAEHVGDMSEAALKRLDRGDSMRDIAPAPFDVDEIAARLDALIKAA